MEVIQSLWIGTKLSNLEKLSIKSFIDNGHTYHLYTYAEVKNIPEGVIVKDGNEILPKNRKPLALFQFSTTLSPS